MLLTFLETFEQGGGEKYGVLCVKTESRSHIGSRPLPVKELRSYNTQVEPGFLVAFKR